MKLSDCRRATARRATAACAVLSLAAALPAAAQNLGVASEGRAALGACYAQCLASAQQGARALSAKFDRLTDLLISDEYHALNTESQDNLVVLEERSICATAQDNVRGNDGCHAGCVDIERAYGVNAATARDRFLHVLRTDRRPLLDAGLWRDYRTSPASGQAFVAACDRYWQSDAAAYGGRPQLAAVQELKATGVARREGEVGL